MSNANELYDVTNRLKDMMLLVATGKDVDTAEYANLRIELLREPLTQDEVPEFIKNCRTIKEFWYFIKTGRPSYQQRRDFVWEEFVPLLNTIEEAVLVAPSRPTKNASSGDNVQDDSTETMMVRPIFGTPASHKYTIDPFDVFVAMPFLSELQPVYENHIKVVAQNLNLTIKRGDDFFSATSIMVDVWLAICAARIVIADCTGRNPNVFYEIGLAHTIGKPVILITQNKDDVPFDLRHLRFINYSYTPPGIKQLEDSLTKTITTQIDYLNGLPTLS